MGNNNQRPLNNTFNKKIEFNQQYISIIAKAINECLINQMNTFNSLNISNGTIDWFNNVNNHSNNDKLLQSDTIIQETKYLNSCFEMFDSKHQGEIYLTDPLIEYSAIDKLIPKEKDKNPRLHHTSNNINEKTLHLKKKEKNIKTIRLGNKDNIEGTLRTNSQKGTLSPKNIINNNIKPKKKEGKKKVKQIVLNIDFKKYKVLNASFSPNKTLNYNNTSVYSGASGSINMNNKSVNSQPAGISSYERINSLNKHFKKEESTINDNQSNDEPSYLQKVKMKLKIRQEKSHSKNKSSTFRSKTPNAIIESKIKEINTSNEEKHEPNDNLNDNYREKFREKYRTKAIKNTSPNKIVSKYNEFISKMTAKGKIDIETKEKNRSRDNLVINNKEQIAIEQKSKQEAKCKEIQLDDVNMKMRDDTPEKEKANDIILNQIKNHISKINKNIPKTEKLNKSVDDIGHNNDIFGVIKNVKYKNQPDSEEDYDSNFKESNMNNSNSNSNSNNNGESCDYDALLPIIRESMESSTSKKSNTFNSSQASIRFSFRPKS